MTRAQRYMARIASIPCVLCAHTGQGDTPSEVHHIGDAAEHSDWLVIPLCPSCHRGPNGFHGLGERAFNARYKTSEIGLLAMTLEALAK